MIRSDFDIKSDIRYHRFIDMIYVMALTYFGVEDRSFYTD